MELHRLLGMPEGRSELVTVSLRSRWCCHFFPQELFMGPMIWVVQIRRENLRWVQGDLRSFQWGWGGVLMHKELPTKSRPTWPVPDCNSRARRGDARGRMAQWATKGCHRAHRMRNARRAGSLMNTALSSLSHRHGDNASVQGLLEGKKEQECPLTQVLQTELLASSRVEGRKEARMWETNMGTHHIPGLSQTLMLLISSS